MRSATRIVVVLVSLAALLGIASATAQAIDADPQVTICHRTNSNKNPYVKITVDQSSVDGLGNGDHYSEHQGPLWNDTLKAEKTEWGDVIPPVAGHHAGLNWDESTGLEPGEVTGQAFIDGGCVTPPVPTYDVTLDKVTTGGTAPAADTDFTFDVLCEPEETATPFTISPEDDPVLVGDDVAKDDLCTITETGSNSATSISYEVTGGAVEGTTANSVTFSVPGAVTVVATNAYPNPQVEALTGDVTLDKELTGGSAPEATTPFDFTVACDSGTVSSPVSISASQDAALVADDVAQGDECTITETSDLTDHDVSFVVTGGSGVTTTEDSVTFTVSSADVSVVATNEYATVAGVVIVPAAETLPTTGAPTTELVLAAVVLLLNGLVLYRGSQLLPLKSRA